MKERDVILDNLIDYQKELVELIEDEENMSLSNSLNALDEKVKHRHELIDKINFCAFSLIDLGIQFGARKINPKKLKDS